MQQGFGERRRKCYNVDDAGNANGPGEHRRDAAVLADAEQLPEAVAGPT
jgi:hypothetical protein